MPKTPPGTGRFKKGQSGNPKGSSRRAQELKKLKALSTKEVAEVGTILLEGNREKLQTLAMSSTESFLKVWTAALMLKGYDEGSPQIYSVVMDRIIGKPKETREISGVDGQAINVNTDTRTPEEKAERAEQLRKLRMIIGEDSA